MVQPKYSPAEALERVKLMMSYDMSKTLNENKKEIGIIEEQYVSPTVAGAGLGAAAGAGLGASGALGAAGVALPKIAGATAIAASQGTGLVGALSSLGVGATAAGAIVGGAAGLALLPLVYWFVTKDTGMNKVKKMFEMCSSEGIKIAKLQRKLQDTDLRSITDDIEDAIVNDSYGFQGGTDEEKLFGAFKKLESGTASDFCALVKYYNAHSDSGDLFDDLDIDIDSESEWKQIYRPIRNCVEDSLLTIKDTSSGGGGNKTGGKTPGKSTYKPCSGTYSYGCKSNTIAKVQGCLGLTPDGKFGKKTKAALASKGFTSFTDADVTKICASKQPVKPQTDEFSVQADADDSLSLINT
jgi:hypothetical protein